MPITRKQFERAIDSEIDVWMRRIHQFLAVHKEEAFTIIELAEELDGFKEFYKQLRDKVKAEGREPPKLPPELHGAFAAALSKLLEIKAVDSREIHGELYYALGGAPLPL